MAHGLPGYKMDSTYKKSESKRWKTGKHGNCIGVTMPFYGRTFQVDEFTQRGCGRFTWMGPLDGPT